MSPAAAGMSKSTVQVVWHVRGLKPHRVQTFKLSNDPRLEEKLADVVGLYMNPPEKAIVSRADEKSSVQALDRTQASLPMIKKRGETMTRDYKRHSTTPLLAALNVFDPRSDQTTHATPPASRVVEVPQDHRPRGAQKPDDPLDLRQLPHPPTPRRQHVAGSSPPAPPAFHPNTLKLVEPSETLAPRADRQNIAARNISFHPRLNRLDPQIHRPTQSQPTPLHADSNRRIHPHQDHLACSP